MSVPGDAGEGCFLTIGEIHTGLLNHSGAVGAPVAVDLLGLVPRPGVRTWERPIRQASSPELLTGVDCDLPTASGTRIRGVGTVASDVWITGGNVLQSSSRVRIAPSGHRRRLPWSHYLARPGLVESLTNGPVPDLVAGFLENGRAAGGLDLTAITNRWMDIVQRSRLLDHRPPFRQARTRLRWSALAPEAGEPSASIRFTLESETLRTVRLQAPATVAARLPALCQDLARHDWLLSVIVATIDRADTGRRAKADVIRRLQPAVDHLLHAWMPAARLPDELLGFWSELERRAGFSRQWESAVARIRDQVGLAAADYLAGTAARVIALPSESAATSR